MYAVLFGAVFKAPDLILCEVKGFCMVNEVKICTSNAELCTVDQEC
jgi:hypothetical protein